MGRDGKTTGRTHQEDDVLIRKFLENDMASFNKLVIKYQDMVFNLCFRILCDYDDASDCAQETFIKVYNNLRQFRFQASFTTWLYRIAVNTCRNRISSPPHRMKKKTIRINTPADVDKDPIDIEDCSYDPGVLYEKNENARIIHEAIESLPESLKILVVLRDLEGKSYEEISDITGVNLGTVKSRLARARHLLRESLRELL